MIPGPLFSWPQLLLLLSPFLALLLGLGLLTYAALWRSNNHHLPKAQRQRFWRASTITVALLVAAGGIWGLFLLYKTYEFDRQFTLETHYRQSRQQFVLPQDFQYGELLIPKGSLITATTLLTMASPSARCA